MPNNDRFDVFQKKVVGIAISSAVVYFYLLDKLKDGLGVIFPYVQQAVALSMIVLVILSGWKFVEIVFKTKSKAGEKISELLDKDED